MHQRLVPVVAAACLLASGCGAPPEKVAGAESSVPAPSPPTSSATPTQTPTPAVTVGKPSPSAKPSVKSRTVWWDTVRPGMCVREPKDDRKLVVTDCVAKHDSEVMANTRLRGKNVYPGDDAIDAQAMTTCEQYFARYVGRGLDDSVLAVGFYSPTAEGWADGDRTLVCLVYDPSLDLLTRRLKGSGE